MTIFLWTACIALVLAFVFLAQALYWYRLADRTRKEIDELKVNLPEPTGKAWRPEKYPGVFKNPQINRFWGSRTKPPTE